MEEVQVHHEIHQRARRDGLLHNEELGGWRAPLEESLPEPRAGEIVVFEDFFKRGSGSAFSSGFASLLRDWDL